MYICTGSSTGIVVLLLLQIEHAVSSLSQHELHHVSKMSFCYKMLRMCVPPSSSSLPVSPEESSFPQNSLSPS